MVTLFLSKNIPYVQGIKKSRQLKSHLSLYTGTLGII